jgi:hypothetical protein
MTRAEALALLIERCNAWLARELENTEALLLGLNATPEEFERAIGPDGFCRKMLEEDRDQQIAEVERWLGGNGGTLH